MHISIKSVSLILLVFILFCSMFLSDKSSGGGLSEPEVYSASRVLGVSDVMAQKPIEERYTMGFAQSDNVPEVPVDLKNSEKPEMGNTMFLVMDLETEVALSENNADKVVPIASITKLATALVFMDTNPDWDTEYEIQASDKVEGGRIYLYTGEIVTVKDLFYLSLVGSANTATRALVKSTGMTEAEFVNKMNEKVKELGLKKTTFMDPIGLSVYNSSTAREVAQLAKLALEYEEISEATQKEKYIFKTKRGRLKTVYSTDDLLTELEGADVKVLGGKTGYTDSAGYCFVGKFVNSNNEQLISVVLGTEKKSSRFYKTRQNIEWAYANFKWR